MLLPLALFSTLLPFCGYPEFLTLSRTERQMYLQRPTSAVSAPPVGSHRSWTSPGVPWAAPVYSLRPCHVYPLFIRHWVVPPFSSIPHPLSVLFDFLAFHLQSLRSESEDEMRTAGTSRWGSWGN